MRGPAGPLSLFVFCVCVACGFEEQDATGGSIGTFTTGPGLDDGDDECGDGVCCSAVSAGGTRFRCSTTGAMPITTIGDSGSDTSTDGGSDTEAADSESGGDEPVCGVSVLIDGGFELGSPNPSWTETTSLPGSPICDDTCSPDPGAQPYAGEWFAWFGGVERPAQMSLSQTFTLTAETAELRFRFALDASSGSGDDTFAVLVDGNTVFMRTDADDTNRGGYTLVPLTLDQYADGESHELRFEGEVFGGGLTSFFVDEVELVGCGEPGGGSETSGDAEDDTTGPTDSSGTTA